MCYFTAAVSCRPQNKLSTFDRSDKYCDVSHPATKIWQLPISSTAEENTRSFSGLTMSFFEAHQLDTDHLLSSEFWEE